MANSIWDVVYGEDRFKGLLGQEGVHATGGGTVYDPTTDYKETRYDNQGNSYLSNPDAPLIPGHTRAGDTPMFESTKVELPPVQSPHDYGSNYYSDEPWTPKVTRPNVQSATIDSLLAQQGVNQVTQQEQEQFNRINASQNRETRYDDQGNPYQVRRDLPLIPGHTRSLEPQSVEPKVDPMSLYNRQGRADYTPQNIVSDEVVEGSPSLGYYPNEAERAYQEEAWYQEQDKIEAQIQELLKGTALEQQSLEAEDDKLLQQFQQDDFNQRVQDRLSQPTPDWLGQSQGALTDAQREDLNRYTDTDSFGNPLDTDAFGNTNYETNLNRQLDKLNRPFYDEFYGADAQEQAPTPQQASNTTDFFRDRAQASKKYQDAILNIGDTIGEGVSSLYEGAKDLGSNIDLSGVGESISNVWGDLTKKDDRSFVERMSDTEQNIAQPIREGITDTASTIYDLMQRGEDVAYRGVKGAFDETIKPLAQDWYNRVTREAEKDVKAYDQGKDVGGLMSQNIGKNMAEIVKGTVDAVASPVETADAIASVFSGALQHALPDEMSWNEESKQMASALGQIYAERYGSLEGFKKALAEQPADVIAEVTGVGLLTKLGATKLASKLNDPEFLDKIDELSRQLPETQMSAGMGRSELFAGTKGAEALGKTDLLNRAEKLERTGASKNDIWKYTGFIRGQDGNWRFELDSSKMKLRDNVDIQQFKIGNKSDYSRGYFTLDRLLDYPELYSAYPQLKNIDVLIDNSLESDSAFTTILSPREIEITIPPHGNTRSLLEHEIQHAIQAIEGHASGSSTGREIFYMLQENKKYQSLQKKKADLEAQAKPLRDYIKKTKGQNTVERGQKIAERDKIKREWESVTSEIHEIEKRVTRSSGQKQAYKNYRNTAGEAEAREAENRLNMSNSQRKSTIPTWDKVADEDVILRFDELESFNDGVLGQVGKDYKGTHTAPQPEGKNSLDDFSEIFPDNANDPNFARYYGMGGEYAKADAETIAVMKAVQGNPDAEVTIYRAVPKGTKDINAGDWVSTSKDYTKKHGERYIDGDYDIIEKKVRAGDLHTDGDLHEWGYNPSKTDDGVLGQVGKTTKDTVDTLEQQAKKYKTSEDWLRAGGADIDLLDEMAFGFSEKSLKTLSPKDLNIKWKDDMLNVEQAIRKSGKTETEWAKSVNLEEPIDVVFENGKFYVDDGHHRYKASKILNKDLNINLEIKDKPIAKITGTKNYNYDDFVRGLWNKFNSKADDGVLGQVGKKTGNLSFIKRNTDGTYNARVFPERYGENSFYDKKGITEKELRQDFGDGYIDEFLNSTSERRVNEGATFKKKAEVPVAKVSNKSSDKRQRSPEEEKWLDENYPEWRNNSALAIPTGGILGMGESEETQADETEGLLKLNKTADKPMKGVLDGVADSKVQRGKNWDNLSSKIRNYVNVKTNNPGNLTFSKNPIDWDGGVDEHYETDKDKYYQFTTPEYGIRALTRDITNKRDKKGLDTIAKIIPVYSPKKSGNDPENYIRIVSQRTGIDRDAKLTDDDMMKIVKGITHMEGAGSLAYYTDDIVIKGIKMAYRNRYQNIND